MARQTNLLWASTGHGKTALLLTFARGLWLERKLKTRLVSAEKAQSEGMLREGIEAGWIIPWWIDDRREADGSVTTPFERMTDAMLGKWPLDLANPFSPLVSAFSIQYKAVCRNVEKHQDKADVLVYQSDKPTNVVAQLKCPKCSQAVVLETVRVVTDKRLEEVGAYFLEGLTEFGAIMMQNMAQRAAKGESTGGDIPVRFQDGGLWIGAATRGHYGTAQSQIKNKVGESRHLPVDYVWWTAGREDGKDSDRNVTVFGPKLPGSAATADVPRWFGTTLSCCAVPVTAGANGQPGDVKLEYRLYLKPYRQHWIDTIKMMENVVDNRIPPERLKGIPDYVKIDHEQAQIEVAGIKMKPETILWEITKLIESRQNPPTKIIA